MMRIGYLFSRYPVLSQTFVDTEMLELERRGFELVVGSIYPPKTELRHPYLKHLKAKIHYAPDRERLEKMKRGAMRSGRWPERLVAEHHERFGPDYKAALRARNALFFVELFERTKVPFVHVHFTNRAAHTAIFVKEISGIPFGVTAHGQDFMIDLGSHDLLREICAAAEFVAAETDYSTQHLQKQCPESADKIVRVYNGIDLSRYPPVTQPARQRKTGLGLLSVGRLVDFKGFDILIEACARLRDAGLEFSCEIVGEGDLRGSLQEKIRVHQLEKEVQLSGEQTQDYVLNALRDCDLFVLAARVDTRGASDIFPTVIAEAMAMGRPVISTTVAGIPELVAHGETGLLVEPDNAEAFARAIEQLARDGQQREFYGAAARARMETRFPIAATVEPLLQRFQSCPTAATARA